MKTNLGNRQRMRPRRILFLFTIYFCVAFIALSCVSPRLLAAQSVDAFPVQRVIRAIEAEINRARYNRNVTEPTFRITSVDITLSAAAISEVGGGITFEIPVVKISLGGEITELAKWANTQTISLTLEPQGEPLLVEGTDHLGLVPAIQSVKAALLAASTKDYRFGLKKFDFTAEFVVATNEKGEVRFFFLKGGAKHQDIKIQRITFRLTPALQNQE